MLLLLLPLILGPLSFLWLPSELERRGMIWESFRSMSSHLFLKPSQELEKAILLDSIEERIGLPFTESDKERAKESGMKGPTGYVLR